MANLVDYIDEKNYREYIGKTISVKRSVHLVNMNLVELPITFIEVGGNFECHHNNLKTLKGCPKEVGGDFICSYNKLTSLEGTPDTINGNFDCSHNILTSLEVAPQKVGGYFDCSYNKLTNLDVSTKFVGESLICDVNNYITDTMINILNERYRKLNVLHKSYKG